MEKMTGPGLFLFSLLLILSACTPAPAAQPATALPSASATPASALPTLTGRVEATPSLTPQPSSDLFVKISRSTDVLHRKCDPLEIIFDVTVSSPDVKGVAFFFRMKDKATGIVNSWSNGENMHPGANGVFEFIFQASAIPDEARFKDAWVQYQFVAMDRNLHNLGHSPIFDKDLTYTPGCP
jgi:hypothetical protein